MSATNYFDLFDLFRNELFGDTLLFVAGGALIIWFIGMKFKFPIQVNALLIIVWFAIVFVETKITLIMILIALIVSFLYFYAIKDDVFR